MITTRELVWLIGFISLAALSGYVWSEQIQLRQETRQLEQGYVYFAIECTCDE